jgi:hypothetical protein
MVVRADQRLLRFAGRARWIAPGSIDIGDTNRILG